jgi:hypothetical protein
MLDFNRANLSSTPLNLAINDAIAHAAVYIPRTPRPYLGASIAGGECLRKIQYDWMCDLVHPVRLLDIFARGHFFEEQSRKHLIAAGFKFKPAETLGFVAVNGLLQGHVDGIITAGPELPGITYPCLWEHKAVNSKGWRALERDGLEKAYPQYAAQVTLYQAYLDIPNPALFTVLNADSCERLHLIVSFDAQRAQAWSDRAVTVIEATRAGELLPRFTDDPTDWRCKMCGHRERCWETT